MFGVDKLLSLKEMLSCGPGSEAFQLNWVGRRKILKILHMARFNL